MIVAIASVVTALAAVVFGALILAMAAAYAACAGTLLVQAFVDLMPTSHTREPSA